MVAWLASPACRFTGRIFGIKGGELAILQRWAFEREFDNGEVRWTPEALDAALAEVA